MPCPFFDIRRNGLAKALDACVEYALLIEIVLLTIVSARHGKNSPRYLWLSNCQFCPEIRPIHNLATGTAVPLVFATVKTVLVLVVQLLVSAAKRGLGSQPTFRDALD